MPVLYSPDGATIHVGSGGIATQSPSLGFGMVLGVANNLFVTQDDIHLPPVASINDAYRYRPVANASGAARELGDVMCWQISDRMQSVEVCSTENQYFPAGIVVPNGIASAKNGFLCYRGRAHYAKVLGAAGMTKGVPLAPVAGQVYLTAVASPVAGHVYYFYLAEAWETAQVAHKLVIPNCPEPPVYGAVPRR